MRAFVKRVGRDGEFAAVGNVDQCAIVADAEHCLLRWAREVFFDEVEFGSHGSHFRANIFLRFALGAFRKISA